jgi:uncharacterized membrane protein
MHLQLNVSTITRVYNYMYLQLHKLNAHLISIPYFCCMFRCISHHLQRELTCLLKTVCLYPAAICLLHRRSRQIERYDFLGLQYFITVKMLCCVLFGGLQTLISNQ